MGSPKYKVPNDKVYYELFEMQVKKTPNLIAASFGNVELSYEELENRANSIAHLFSSCGIKPEKVVALLGERNLDFWIIVLAILKVGGVYLPLNPYHPLQSFYQVIEKSNPEVIVTSRVYEPIARKLVTTLPKGLCPKLLIVEDLLQYRIMTETPTVSCSPDILSCILFTSGSTGEPKGAMIEHKGMINHIFAKLNDLNISEKDTVAQNGPQSFDISVWQFLGPILIGGQVRIFGDEVAGDPIRLIDQVSLYGINILEIVPSQLRLMLERLSLRKYLPDLSKLKWIVPTGETLSADLCRKWFDLYPQIPMLNTYGTTECSDDVAHYPIYEAPAPEIINVPIGQAIPNMTLYLLDSNKSIVAEGETGEIYIGGVGVGRGYINDNEKTEKVFITNPFLKYETENLRLYRTGDLARLLPDGNIDFLGRKDYQIKIRGIRIEPGEIENSLKSHPWIRDSLVIAHEDNRGNKRLVAYIVTAANQIPKSKDLRIFLRDKLPDYMIPSAFIFIKEMPLNINGKVNRNLLPPPNFNIDIDALVPAMTRTNTEKILANIYSKILGIEGIDLSDNFFDLGGDSLLMIELLYEIREKIGIKLTISDFLNVPNLTQLAHLIDITIATGKSISNIPIGMETLDTFDVDCKLNFVIDNNALEKIRSDNILLTGATGFIGSHLLAELLYKTTSHIYCLVRATDAKEGKARLLNALRENNQLPAEEALIRITPIVGDLSKPNLGLSDTAFSSLAKDIDVIYHNGAIVNFIYPYSLLKATNVFGTHEILRLASQVKKKPVHFVSTLSIFQSNLSLNNRILEIDNPNPSLGFINGYSQSKWAAEQLVVDARNRGLPICIYRLGTVMGHSQTGVSNINDWFCRMLKVCLKIGKIPKISLSIPMTTVDFVASSIVYFSQQSLLGKTFHLVSPYQLDFNNIVLWLQELGYFLSWSSYQEWREELKKYRDNSDFVLDSHFLLEFFEENAPGIDPEFDCNETNKKLEMSGIIPERDIFKLLKSYLSFLKNSGFTTT